MSNNYRLDNILEFEVWLKNRGLNDSSVYQYMKAVQKFLLLKNPDVKDIEPYNEFILEFSIKKRSLYYYDALKLFLKFVFKEDTTKKNAMVRSLLKPNKNNDIKRIRKNLDDETKEQVIRLIKDYKHRIIAKIQNVLGVRAGDIIRLKRGSISYEPYNDVIAMRIDFLGKGGKHFVKYIFDENLQTQIDLFIKNNILDTEYYFLERDRSNNGSSLITLYRTNYHNYWMDLKQAMDTIGINYKDWATHDFRRSFARKVWNKYKDPVVLKDILNHAQFETTLAYLRNSGLQERDVYYDLNIDK